MEKRIVVLADMDSGLTRASVRGAALYVREQTNWDVRLLHSGPELNKKERENLLDWQPAGVLELLCRRFNPLPFLGDIPSVQAGIWDWSEGGKDVGVDEAEIGQLAAEHLLDQGVEVLAFFALHKTGWVKERLRTFQEKSRQAGLQCMVRVADCEACGREDKEWLQTLPEKTGLFVPQDRQAVEIVRSCRNLRIDVPGKVAILSVDDDDLLCEFSRPPLSSIQLPMFAMGYQAGVLLTQRMNGEQDPPLPMKLPPIRVNSRQSTSLLAVADPAVAAAVTFISRYTRGGINVDDVISYVGISRSALQRKFRSVLGRSPLQEIHRVRLEGVREMLIETDKTISEIAEAFGFRDATALGVVFRQWHKCSPGQYRNIYRMQ